MGALWSACEVVINGEFKEAVEQQPSTTGATAVEPEYELVHVVGQVRDVNRSLMGSEQPTFGQRGDAVNSGHQGHPGSPRARAAR
jgi:hypothetical protein